ncbi:WXG100 family type VII secretion target [Cellulomonas sp. URHE0023]|uniref:WXG100 family type VII secretion target n=1 Tax=Cellulomonas sp. URHE0023 TaxID=1380354 RepID=UPI000B0BD74F|nr:WXG100 family type VII secretion target [Cellulomonas sp. URHE0023]
MAVGAELSTLQALYKTFQSNALAAADIKSKVDSGLNSTEWTGKFSEDFRAAWQDYRANLDRLQEALDGAAADVRTNHNNIASATGEGDRI